MGTNEVPATNNQGTSGGTYAGKTEKGWIGQIAYSMMKRHLNSGKAKRTQSVKSLLQGFNEQVK